MLTLKKMAQNLETKLNAAIQGSALQNLIENCKFEFCIFADGGDYKKALRNGNKVTYYINGVMRSIVSDTEGITKESYSGTIHTQLEILIPFADIKDSDGTLVVVESVREIIDGALQTSASEYITDDEDGIIYYLGTSYAYANTGLRDVRAQVSDSMTLTVDIRYYFVASGVASNAIELYVNNERVYYTRIGIMRRSVQDGNVLSTDSAPSARVITSSTALSINMDLTARFAALDTARTAYLMSGEVQVLDVRLTLPVGFNDSGELVLNTFNYSMEFSESTLNGELNLAASSSVSLVEHFTGVT